MAGINWGSLSFLYGPVVAMFGIGILILFLRWGWTRGKSVVGASHRPGPPDNYGQLEVVADCTNLIEAEVLKLALKDAGLQSTVANTTAGPKVMVWPEDKVRAQAILRRRKPI